jgi:hypothetical protein
MANRWYETMPSPNPETMSGYTEWLRQFPWKLFATYTFSWGVSDSQADKVFREYINELEKRLRAPIAFVRGDEKRNAAFGLSESGRHFHTLLTSNAPLESETFKTTWYRYGGSGYKGDSAEVREYSPELGGIDYSLKMINETEGDWSFRNLDLFLLGYSPVKDNKRSRRREVRNRNRENSTA